MTEKITRRGISVPADYVADFLSQILVRDAATYQVVSLDAGSTLGEVRARIAQGLQESTHHGFPVVDKQRGLIGLVSRRALINTAEPDTKRVGDIVSGPCAVVFEDNTLREASDLMVREGLGRLPVVKRESPREVIAILSGSDIREANRQRLDEAHQAEQTIRWR